MKTLVTFLLFVMTNLVNGQTYTTTMHEYLYFKYSTDITLYDAVNEQKIDLDSVSYLVNTLFVFNLNDNTLTYTINSGIPEVHPIINVSAVEPFLSVDVLIKGKGIYNYLFCRNVKDELGMFVRNRLSVDNQIEGFFTNNLELVVK